MPDNDESLSDGSTVSDKTIEDMLVGIGRNTFPEGAICTGWVIVSEWMDADGQYWTFCAVDDRNPPWRHKGLISYVLERGGYEYGEDDDDDDTPDDE